MATQIFGSDSAVLLPRETDDRVVEKCDACEPAGGAVRGFFFAMLFNAMLLLTVAAGWELWRLMR